MPVGEVDEETVAVGGLLRVGVAVPPNTLPDALCDPDADIVENWVGVAPKLGERAAVLQWVNETRDEEEVVEF